MSCAEIHLNDVGTQFIVTILNQDEEAEDLSGYSTKQIIFTKPSGEKLTKTANFYTDGTDGKIYYTSVADDLDEAGTWQIQGVVDGFHSNIETFKIYRNL